jgi:DNA-binding CsgD family transcriptional regulator
VRTESPSSEVVQQLLNEERALPWEPELFTGEPRLVLLTAMQRNIAESISEGRSTAEIGIDWGISEHTVKSHVKGLLGRCGARDRAELNALLWSGAIRIAYREQGNGRWS